MLEKLPESVGQALINQRAGMDNVVYNELHKVRSIGRIELRSSAFMFNTRMPIRFTADGEGISPPLAWDHVPAETQALCLIVEDADSPTPHPLVHAIAIGLGNGDGSLEEGAFDSPDHTGTVHTLGINSFFKRAWLPPDPPRGHGEHRYVFQLIALGELVPTEAPGRSGFIDLVMEHAIAAGCLIGIYERAARQNDDALEKAWAIDDAGLPAYIEPDLAR